MMSSWRKRQKAGDSNELFNVASADEEAAGWKGQQQQGQQQLAKRGQSRASMLMLGVVAMVGCVLLAARSVPNFIGRRLRVQPASVRLNRMEKAEAHYSFRTYSNLQEAIDDVGAKLEGNAGYEFGAVQLCSTATRRSSFEAYTVIPRHDIYYADADVQKWESTDFEEFKEMEMKRVDYDESGKNGTDSLVGFSLSKVGKSNFRRYGNFGAYLRLTIFEAELCSAGRCPSGWSQGISILSVLESHATQEQGKVDNQWTAFNSKIADRLDGGSLDCLFRDAKSGDVVFRTPARLESRAYGGLFLRIFCQTPESVTTGDAVSVLFEAERFGISLASADTAFAIHGSTLDVCRMEERRNQRRLRSAGGSALCVRPLSLHKLFDSAYTVELEHLLAWISYHVYLGGVDHVYLQDRWGEIDRRIAAEWPKSSWVSATFDRLVDDAKLTLISFPFFSPMQTDKHSSNMRYLSTYDQVIAYEVCLSHARQMGDSWLVPLDSDEWFRVGGVDAGGGHPTELGSAIDALLDSRSLTPSDVAEIKFLRYDMHSHASADESDESGFLGNASQWPVEAYRYRARNYHPKPRSTLNPWNAGVMNIHENVPIAPTALLPDPPGGHIVALWDEPLEHAAIAHFTCSQVLRWPLSQWCPCPPDTECVLDAYFSPARALLERQAL